MARKRIFLILCFIAVGFAFRMHDLSRRSLWTDEFFTFFQATGHGRMQAILDGYGRLSEPPLLRARDLAKFLKNDPARSLRDVSEGLLREDTHPPLYFWMMYFWIRLFGDGVGAVRIFSVFMGILSIPLADRVASRLFDERAGIFAALFVSLSPFAVRYSQEARSYSLIVTLGLLSCLLALRFERNRKLADLAGFALVNCAGLFVHYFYLFVACAQFLYFTVFYRKDDALRQRLQWALLVSFSVFFSWFMFLKFNNNNTYLMEWIFGYPVPLFRRLKDLFTAFASYFIVFEPGAMSRYLLTAFWVFFLFPAAGACRDMFRSRRRQLLFCLCISLVPLLAMFSIDLLSKGILVRQERFGAFVFIGLVPFVGYTLCYGLRRYKPAVYALLLLLAASSFFAASRQFGPAPLRVSAWINGESRESRSLVVTAGIRSVVAAQAYYLDGDSYMMPVASAKQLDNGLRAAAGRVDKVFVVRHYFRPDPGLMDRDFLAIRNIGRGFKLAREVRQDDISVSEFVK